TSIAKISKAAGMSPGHIYHYFENKEAIVEAIAKREEQNLSELARKLQEDENGGSLATRVTRQVADSVDRCLDPAFLELQLELVAEAARNPAIQRILRQSDKVVSGEFMALSNRVGLPDGMDAAEVELRMNMISAIFNGVMVRSAVGADVDRRQVGRLVEKLVRCLLDDAG
ncbi:MAG: TetR/AcrR family transcriptional regulator, partial [Stenotrophomonas sp.]